MNATSSRPVGPASFRYEHFTQPLLSKRAYRRRVLGHGGMALAFLVFSLLLGMEGYRLTAGLCWTDAFLNASMILTGMGPVNPMVSKAAKIFSGCYAIYSGVGFLTAMALLFAPILHRFMHRFHVNN
jgi:hypothetical protein